MLRHPFARDCGDTGCLGVRLPARQWGERVETEFREGSPSGSGRGANHAITESALYIARMRLKQGGSGRRLRRQAARAAPGELPSHAAHTLPGTADVRANQDHSADIQYPIVHAPFCGRRDDLHSRLGSEFVEQVSNIASYFKDCSEGAAVNRRQAMVLSSGSGSGGRSLRHKLRQLSDDPADPVAECLTDA
jgi:hypothetical protein